MGELRSVGPDVGHLMRDDQMMCGVDSDLANLEAEANSIRGKLNGMLARDAKASLRLPPRLPSPRPVTADDAQLIALGVEQNPELAGLARQGAGRENRSEEHTSELQSP